MCARSWAPVLAATGRPAPAWRHGGLMRSASGREPRHSPREPAHQAKCTQAHNSRRKCEDHVNDLNSRPPLNAHRLS
jgi:hypothetical protein